jgi:copper chaperone CopZ
MQVQVVVMSANMGCSHCRQRVANVVSKMNGEHLTHISERCHARHARVLVSVS